MAPGAGDGLGAPGPIRAKLSVGYICFPVVSTTSLDPNPDLLLTRDKQIKSQVSEMLQILCQPWEAVKYLGNRQRHDVTRRNVWHAGKGGHVTRPV